MLRTSIFLAASLCVAAPAFAEGVHVSLQGKDTPTIHREIIKAAEQVCAQAAESEPLYSVSDNDVEYCVRRSVDVAVAAVHDPVLTRMHDHTRAAFLVGSR